MKKVILLAGPTAVGKTELSLVLAEKLGGQIICADSMQIYQSLSIGTAKPSISDVKRCPHHLFDFISPFDAYSVSDYQRDAKAKINALLAQNIVPIITGGTGLYFNALMYEMDFLSQKADQALRTELAQFAEEFGREALHDKLKQLDREKANEIHPNNIQRVIRAIEVASNRDTPQQSFKSIDEKTTDYKFQLIVLERPREELYERINCRVDLMVKMGLFEEVKSLLELGLTAMHQSMKGIGYKEIIPYYEGNTTYEESIQHIKINSRHYAKRQLTWFKRYSDAKWVDLSKVDVYNGLNGDIITNIIERTEGFNESKS